MAPPSVKIQHRKSEVPVFFVCRFFGVGSVCASEKTVEDGGNHAERLLKALYFFFKIHWNLAACLTKKQKTYIPSFYWVSQVKHPR